LDLTCNVIERLFSRSAWAGKYEARSHKHQLAHVAASAALESRIPGAPCEATLVFRIDTEQFARTI